MLSVDVLQKIKEYLTLPTEVCGIFVKDEKNFLKIDKLTFGSVLKLDDAKTRGMCVHEEYSKIIFHTHNLEAKGYPSVEDVKKIMKQKAPAIDSSILFSKFGIFVMNCEKKAREFDKITPIITHYLDAIYFKTEKGTKVNVKEIRLLLSKMTEKLKYFELKIEFTPWEEIEGSFVLP